MNNSEVLESTTISISKDVHRKLKDYCGNHIKIGTFIDRILSNWLNNMNENKFSFNYHDNIKDQEHWMDKILIDNNRLCIENLNNPDLSDIIDDISRSILFKLFIENMVSFYPLVSPSYEYKYMENTFVAKATTNHFKFTLPYLDISSDENKVKFVNLISNEIALELNRTIINYIYSSVSNDYIKLDHNNLESEIVKISEKSKSTWILVSTYTRSILEKNNLLKLEQEDRFSFDFRYIGKTVNYLDVYYDPLFTGTLLGSNKGFIFCPYILFCPVFGEYLSEKLEVIGCSASLFYSRYYMYMHDSSYYKSVRIV